MKTRVMTEREVENLIAKGVAYGIGWTHAYSCACVEQLQDIRKVLVQEIMIKAMGDLGPEIKKTTAEKFVKK